ncbi:hypothetical protein HYS47_03775 [Candidatus Woesearchaeota archaeon]|nr:hypothetical protein [Candidatus Woesearchaeota archaeon]
MVAHFGFFRQAEPNIKDQVALTGEEFWYDLSADMGELVAAFYGLQQSLDKVTKTYSKLYDRYLEAFQTLGTFHPSGEKFESSYALQWFNKVIADLAYLTRLESRYLGFLQFKLSTFLMTIKKSYDLFKKYLLRIDFSAKTLQKQYKGRMPEELQLRVTNIKDWLRVYGELLTSVEHILSVIVGKHIQKIQERLQNQVASLVPRQISDLHPGGVPVNLRDEYHEERTKRVIADFKQYLREMKKQITAAESFHNRMGITDVQKMVKAYHQRLIILKTVKGIAEDAASKALGLCSSIPLICSLLLDIFLTAKNMTVFNQSTIALTRMEACFGEMEN